jgi:hypothetical protein
MDANILGKPMASLITSYFMRLTHVGYFKYVDLKQVQIPMAKCFITSMVVLSPKLQYSSIVFITTSKTNILNVVVHF